jgi:hypothetical protein
MRNESGACVLPFPTETAILARFYQDGCDYPQEYHKNVVRKLETEKALETRQQMRDAYTNTIWAIITEYDLQP